MPHLRLFGGAAMERDDGAVVDGPAVHRHPLALLALLATDPSHSRSRRKLVGLLWPEAREETARNRLTSCLYQLRSELGEDVLVSRGDEVVLDTDRLACDIVGFQRALEEDELEEAVALYDGPFLDGFALPGSPAFEKWTERVRDRLARRYREALESLAERAEERSEPTAAVRWWRQRAREDPYDARVTRRFMRALAAAGNRPEALRVGREHRRRLEDELGVDPSPEVEELAERLASGQAEIPPPAVEDGRVDPVVGSEAPDVEGGDFGIEKGPPARDRADAGKSVASGVRARLALPLVLTALVLVAAAASQFLDSDGERAAPAGEHSVAVLPFPTIGSGEAGAVAEGLHADLLTRLSHVSRLDVVSGTSVARFRDADLPLSAIADSLGAGWVVEGDVQRMGDEIEVHVQLIDPSTDTHAWAKTYRRELTAARLFDLQAEISRRVAGALASRIPGGEEERLARRPTGSLAAHRFYVRGRSLMEQREPGTLERALAYFDQALAEDSAYALAWAGRANGLTHLARHSGFDPDTLLPRAREAADRALALQPDLAEAHAARGRLHMFGGDAPAALQAFGRAVALRPSYAAAHAWRAKLQLSIGRPGEGLAKAERAVELDPLSRENQGTLVWALLANRRHERALAAARRATELGRELLEDPNRPWGYEMLVLSHLRRTGAMVALVRRSDIPLDEAPYVAITLASVGDPAPARRLTSRHAESEAPVLHALVHAALGDEDRALSLLRDVFPREDVPWDAWGSVHLRYFWPELLGPVRDGPGYEALMAEINRSWGLEPDGSLPDDVAVSPAGR